MQQANSVLERSGLKNIAVGSLNCVKLQAVQNAWDDPSVTITPYSVPSNVPSQPLSDEETLEGAINRALNSLMKSEADLGFGLEAGIVFIRDDVYLSHWGAIVDRSEKVYFTNGPLILLPADYREPLLRGKSLEEIMHGSTGIQKLGAKEGAIGVFTENRLNREQVMTQMVKVLIGQYFYYEKLGK